MPARARRTIAVSASMLVLVGALVSCAFAPQPTVTRLPTDGSAARPLPTTPAPSASASQAIPTPGATDGTVVPGDATDCGGSPVNLTGGSATSFVLRGDCPSVAMQGSDLSLDATDATLGSLDISGDRAAVALTDAASVSVQGNDVVVIGAGITTLVMRGDRNTATLTAALDAVQVSGNDNTVSAARIDSVAVAGSGNTVG